MTDLLRHDRPPGLVRRAVAFEAGIWRSLFDWIFKRTDRLSPSSRTFGYAAEIAPLLWVFVVMSAVEIPLFHFVFPWQTVRIIFLILGAWGLIWMVGFLASMKVYPHEVDNAGLRIRYSAGVDFTLDWDVIDSVERVQHRFEGSKAIRFEQDPGSGGTTLQLVAGSDTNLSVVLVEPVTIHLPGGSRTITRVDFRADEPAQLLNAVREIVGQLSE